MYIIPNSENLLEKYHHKMSTIFSKLIDGMDYDKEFKNRLRFYNQYPYVHYLIKQILDNNISSNKILKMIKIIESVSISDIQKINSGKIVVSQNQYLVSDEETRGKDLIVDNSISEEILQNSFDEYCSSAINFIGESWKKFIKPIKTVTYINVPGLESIPFFSGSNNYLFGAICLSPQTKPWITAEVLSHEAAHHWLFLIEEFNQEMANNGWDDNIYYSPWREDPRPTMGLIHGIYVFSSVATALWSYYEKKCLHDKSNEDILTRISFIIEQVKCAYEEINKSHSVTEYGLSICSSSSSEINNICKHLPSNILNSSRDRVYSIKNTRINENGLSKYAAS